MSGVLDSEDAEIERRAGLFFSILFTHDPAAAGSWGSPAIMFNHVDPVEKIIVVADARSTPVAGLAKPARRPVQHGV